MDGLTVRSPDRNLHAIDTTYGLQKWAFKKGGKICSRPEVSTDGVTEFVGSEDCNLYAVHTDNGFQKWAFDPGNEPFDENAILSKDGSTVFVGSSNHSLHAIHTANGSQKWT
jgi:outer membrane protein assembly factor BamB